jgi:hypothetical protein
MVNEWLAANHGGWAKYISTLDANGHQTLRMVEWFDWQSTAFPSGFPQLSTKILLDIRSSHQILLATMIIYSIQHNSFPLLGV